MIRKHFRFKRFALGLAFAVVSAALLVPTAVAKPVGYEMSSPQTITPLQADGLRWQAMADFYTQQAQQASAPGITAAGTAIANQQHNAYPVPVTVSAAPGITAAGTAIANQQHNAYPVPVTASAASSDGFSWSDAGIGASAVFAGVLVLLTVIGLGRRNRTRGLANA
jgi:hypothetical protein